MIQKLPVPDLLALGRDDRANSLAIFKRTGIGKMPQHVGDIGWFGEEYIKTMMVDCGCGKGDDCTSPTIFYVELLPDNGYAFYYDDEGQFVVCNAQYNVLMAKKGDHEDVFAYLDAIQNDYRNYTAEFESLVQPSIDDLKASKTRADLAKLQANLTSLPSVACSYVMGRMGAAAAAHFEYSRRRLVDDALEYVERINAGQTLEAVLADAQRDGVDSELLDILTNYGQSQSKRMGDSSGWSGFPSTGTIH